MSSSGEARVAGPRLHRYMEPLLPTFALSEQERGYVAGIIDGEGSIRFWLTPEGGAGWQVRVDNTNAAVLHWLKDHLGGEVSRWTKRGPSRALAPGGGRRAAYEVRCLGDDEGQRPMAAAHHLTYERIGRETLSDLLGVCGGCHAYLSAKSQDDPLAADIASRRIELIRELDQWAAYRGREHEEDAADILAVAIEKLVDALGWAELVARGLPVDGAARLARQMHIDIQPWRD